MSTTLSLNGAFENVPDTDPTHREHLHHWARQLKASQDISDKGLVFTARDGGAVYRGNFRTRHWSSLLRKAKLRYRGFHHARHSYATLQLGAGVPVHVVSKILGHAKASTTLDIYAHALQQQQTEATAAISTVLGCCPVVVSRRRKSS